MVNKSRIALALIATSVLASISTQLFSQDVEQAEREAIYRKYLSFSSHVVGGRIEPHWMADGNSFWYVDGDQDNIVIWKVDPVSNTKAKMFRTDVLRVKLARLLGHQPPGNGLPFRSFRFTDEKERVVKFSVEGKDFQLELDTYQINAYSTGEVDAEPTVVRARTILARPGEFPLREIASSSGNWFVGFNDHNLYLRAAKDDEVLQITDDGMDGFGWTPEFWPPPWCSWSPDGSRVAVTKWDTREAIKVPVVHWLKREADVDYHPYSWVAEAPIVQRQLYLLDVATRRPIPVHPKVGPNALLQFIAWRPDGSEFLFWEYDRHFKKLVLKAADATTGTARTLIAEESKKYHRNAVRWYVNPRLPFFVWLDNNRFIWMSERNGWDHLFLYDLEGGSTQLTVGEFPVDRVVTIDVPGGWVYFLANVDRRRPYDLHLCRVKLEGKKMERLTHSPHNHRITQNLISPSKKFFIDIHSSISDPPVAKLSRSDGTHLTTLSTADVKAIDALGRQDPEEFVVLASDNQTPIYGVLYKPFDFDHTKKYPVIDVLGGIPTSYDASGTGTQAQALAQLGFVTIVVEPRGTEGRPGRKTEFYDIRYGNVGRYEIEDHVATLRQLGKERPYLDLSRVGIEGGSYNGYLALRAILSQPKSFHVAVVVAAFTDLSEHGSSVFLGPIAENKEAYESASNRRLAANLEGKLLLIHGTADTAVPVSHTMKMVDAFIDAGKHFDMLVLPDWGHWGNERIENYWMEAKHRYFQEHLRP